MWNPDSSPDRSFTPLPLGTIVPTGWLADQLRIQADGQTGLLTRHWPDLMPETAWLGGDGEGWERGPYFMDGYVPLAFLLKDGKMIDEAAKWMDWTLKSQTSPGRFGPAKLDDWWPMAIMLKALAQYEEATGDPRVVPFMERFFAYLEAEAPTNPFKEWAAVRWADMALPLEWLYRKTGNDALDRPLAEIHRQGMSWTHWFAWFPATRKPAQGAFRFSHMTHVVNNAMGIKAPAVEWQITGWETSREASWSGLKMLDEFHGQANGCFTGDEHLAGLSPTQGTEVCAVVEYMYSLEKLMQTFGDPAFGDRLELLAYNALPGTFDPLMMAHQYDQQANQVLCDIHPRDWVNNEPDSNIFGLDPNFGCCTSNYHQGFPKLVSSMWAMSDDGGLALLTHGPCRLETNLNGAKVEIEVVTDYPFRSNVTLQVKTDKAVRLPIAIRVPGWAKDAKIDGEVAKAGSFHTLTRDWRGTTKIEMDFPMPIEVKKRPLGGVSIQRGPLVYSLRIGEEWKRIRGIEAIPDYAVYPTTPWNYALETEGHNLEAKTEELPMVAPYFAPDRAPIRLTVPGRRVPDWGLVNGSAGPVPTAPKNLGPTELLELVPYGCAKLRITEFPTTG